jgi:hypothetical protein
MSSTLLRSVSSPPPSTMAFFASGSASASAVAWNREPISAPPAPSAVPAGLGALRDDSDAERRTVA